MISMNRTNNQLTEEHISLRLLKKNNNLKYTTNKYKENEVF